MPGSAIIPPYESHIRPAYIREHDMSEADDDAKRTTRIVGNFVKLIVSGKAVDAARMLHDPVKYRVSSNDTATVSAIDAVLALDLRRDGAVATTDGFDAIYDYGHPKVTLKATCADGRVRTWHYNFKVEGDRISFIGVQPPIA
jgi:hypothetical protein